MLVRRILLGTFSLAAAAMLVGCAADESVSEGDTSRIGQPIAGAAFTTTNTAVDGKGHCKNGNEDVNCNVYDGKSYVWLNGGPDTAYVGDGNYFFSVLVPGGQPSPNDGGLGNLSDDFDTWNNRRFSVKNGQITYGGTHGFANNKIRLMPYADTTNPGGVYILAVCSLGSGPVDQYPVTPRSCKYDAFKALKQPKKSSLTVTSDATATYSRRYGWTVDKNVDKTSVKGMSSGTATFNYTVDVSHDAGTDGSFVVAGTITVENFNAFDVAGVTITDAIDDPNATCVVQNGTNLTIAANGGGVTRSYTCTYSAPPASMSETNTATASWPSSYSLPTDSATFVVPFSFPSAPSTVVDECVTVTDTFDGVTTTLGTVCIADPNPMRYSYPRSVPIPAHGCVSHANSAVATASTSGLQSQDGVSVQACGPLDTGARTIGFWQNPNGQGILQAAAATGGVCDAATWLRQYAPFQSLGATSTCADLAAWVYDVIKSANAAGEAMNAMLEAQMLATALDVYFSDAALGGNAIGAPAPLGPVVIDLTAINGTLDTSAAFGGAKSMSILQLLAYAASQSNAGGTVWYGNDKATQGLAKTTFDAINNNRVFAP